MEIKILESAWNTSAQEPISRTDWAKAVYGEGVDINVAKNRVGAWLAHLRRKLAAQGIRIVNTEPTGQQSKYYVEKTTPKEVEKTLPKIIINRETREVEIDGIKKVIGSDSRWQVLLELAKNYNQPVRWDILEAIAKEHGYEGRFPVGSTMRNLRRMFETDDPQHPPLITRFGPMHNSQYQLNAVVEFAGEVEIASEEVKLPKIIIDFKTREIRLNGKIKDVGSEIRKAVFMHFARNPKKEFTKEELSKIAAEAGSKDQKAGSVRVFELRQIFEKDPRNPTIFIKTKNGYQLNADVEIIEEEKGAAFEQPKDEVESLESTLVKMKVNEGSHQVEVNGKVVTFDPESILWKSLINLAKAQTENNNKSFSTQELDEIAITSGSGIKKWPGSIMLKHLREKLDDPKNPQIFIRSGVPQNSQYQINAIIELESVSPAEESTETAAEVDSNKLTQDLLELRNRRQSIAEKIEVGILTQSAGILEEIDAEIANIEAKLRLLRLTEEEVDTGMTDTSAEVSVERPAEEEEIKVYPYVPLEEEHRSEEENKILEYIINTLKSNNHIRFEELQASVFSNKRFQRRRGHNGIMTYSENDLKNMFREAIRKMREEVYIPFEKENWSEQDNTLWDNIQIIANRLSGGDIDDFIRRVTREIDRSKRALYGNNPVPPWIAI